MPGEGTAEMLVWPLVTPVGFLLLAAVIIALGASSTAKYEFERNRVQAGQRQSVGAAAPAARTENARATSGSGSETQEAPVEQGTAVGLAAHPAGRHRVAPDAEPAWWLVDESVDPAGSVVAGPFADRMDADWAALSTGLSETVQAVHGVQRADGGLVRRQSAQEKAWLAELGSQLDRLPLDWDELLTDDDALTTLVVEVAAALVEAGLPVHDCAGDDAAGGVCLTPGPEYAGVVVSWHQHERMSGLQTRDTTVTAAVQSTMNAAVAALLSSLGFEVEPFTSTGSILVTDIRGLG